MQLDNYHIFRCDRSAVNFSKCRGGEVLLAVRNHIPSKTYPVSLCDIEAICGEIGPQTKPKIFVIVAYIPPNAAPSKISHLAKFVETIFKSMRDIGNII